MHAVGGTADHVHMAVTVPPNVTISEWIGQLKGSSSHYINHKICNRKVLAWQDGYGVVSYGTRNLAWIVDYVSRQKEHHARGRTHDRLERTDPPSDEDRGMDGDSSDGGSPLEAG